MSKPRRGRHERPARLPVPEDPGRPWDFAVAETLKADVERLLRALPLRACIPDVEIAIEAHALALAVAQLNAAAARAAAPPARLAADLRRTEAQLRASAAMLERLPDQGWELLRRELGRAFGQAEGFEALLLGRLFEDMRHGLPQVRGWLPRLVDACSRAASAACAADVGEPDQLADAAAATFNRLTGKRPPRSEAVATPFTELVAALLELAGFGQDASAPKVARRAAERMP